jgi:hypothetical protein
MAGIGPTGSSLGAARVRVRAATPPVTASIPATTSAPSANGTLRSGRAPWVIGGVVLAGVAAAALATWLIRRDRSGDGPGPGPGTDPEPLPDQLISVGQLNAYNLFDTVDDPKKQDDVATPAEYDLHLRKLALTLRDGMGAPDVVTLQEVENEQVLRDLVARPEIAALGYVPVLREGRDPRGIDVAVLYRGDRLAEASVATWDTDGVSPSGRKQKDFTRPPLVVELTPRGGADGAQAGARSITAVALHLTSRLQGTDGERRRSQQAASVAGPAASWCWEATSTWLPARRPTTRSSGSGYSPRSTRSMLRSATRTGAAPPASCSTTCW